MSDDVTSSRTEYGLALPNGTTAWNEYRGHPIQTAEQRWFMLQVLRKTAAEVGFDEDEFLSCYGWVSRTVTTTIRDTQQHPISELCSAPSELPESP